MQLRLAAAVAGLILLVLFTFVWHPPQADLQPASATEQVEDAGPELFIAPPPEDFASPGTVRKTDRLVQPAGGSTLSSDLVLPAPVLPAPQAGSSVQIKPRPKAAPVPKARTPRLPEAGSVLLGRPVPRPPAHVSVLPEAGSVAGKADRLPAMPRTVILSAGVGQQPTATPPTSPSTLAKYIAINSDGSQVAIGDTNGEIRLLDIESRSVTRTIKLETGALLDLLYTPDGALLATATGHQLLLFDPVSGDVARRYKTGDTFPAIQLVPGGEHIIATSLAGRVVRLSLTTGDAVGIGSHPTAVSTLAVSPDGRRAATGSLEGIIRIRNLGTNDDQPIVISEPLIAGLQCLTFSPDSQRLAGVGAMANIRIWTLELKGVKLDRTIGTLQKTSTIQFARDPRHLYFVSQAAFSYVYHIDTQTGVIAPLTNGNAPSTVRDMAMTPDGLTLVTLFRDRSIHVVTLDPATSTVQKQSTITTARNP